jgi:hypothetical protein
LFRGSSALWIKSADLWTSADLEAQQRLAATRGHSVLQLFHTRTGQPLAEAEVTKVSRRERAAAPRLARARVHLEARRDAVLAVAARATENDLARRPAHETWSGLEILDHLALVEQFVVGMLRAPRPQGVASPVRGAVPRILRMLPASARIVLVERRIGRVAAPRAVRPAGAAGLEAVLRRLHDVRAATRAALDAGDPLHLAEVRRAHAILGDFDGIEWLEFVAAHDARHLRQLRAALRR